MQNYLGWTHTQGSGAIRPASVSRPVSSLAGLDPLYHGDAAAALREIIANPGTDASDRRQAVSSLAGLDPQYHEDAAAALREIIANPGTGTSDRRQAAESLAGLGLQNDAVGDWNLGTWQGRLRRRIQTMHRNRH